MEKPQRKRKKADLDNLKVKVTNRWLKKFHLYLQEHECQDYYLTWSILAVVSSVASAKVWTRLGYHKVYPNIYVVLVGPPAEPRKNQAINSAMDMLDPLEKDMLVFTSSESITAARMLDDMKATRTEINIAGEPYEYMGLCATATELSTFVKPGHSELPTLLIELFDGKGRYRHGTRQSGTVVLRNTCFTMLAATTPIFFEGMKFDEQVRTGFTSRCIFLYAKTRRLNNVRPNYRDNEALKQELIAGLFHIAENARGEIGLTEEAACFIEDWYENMKAPPNVIQQMVPYYGRKQAHVMKVAMSLCLLDTIYGDELVITIQQIKEAMSILTQSERYMKLSYQEAGRSADKQDAQELEDYLKGKKDWVLKVDIYRDNCSNVEFEVIGKLLNIMVVDVKTVERRIHRKTGETSYRWREERKT